MIRTLIILTFFISSNTFAQVETFDKKVEHLFFNKDMSVSTVIDTLAAVKEISYTKPTTYSSYFMPTGILSVLSHNFTFTQSQSMPIPFDKGLIIIQTEANGKTIKDITLELQYAVKEAAVKAFSDLKSYFSMANVEKKEYKSRIAMGTAEFTNNNTPAKYPHLRFMLFNNHNEDKKYKIRLFLE